MMSKKRIAVITDFFLERGGAEKVALILANSLNADLYTTFFDRKVFRGTKIKSKVNEFGLFFKNIRRFNLLTYAETAFRYKLNQLPDYDLYIFFGLHCISVANKYHPNIWFSNSPVRFLFDLHDSIYKRISVLHKPIFKIWSSIYKRMYLGWIDGVVRTVANSFNTKKKIERYYKMKSEVIYPPVEISKYKCKGFEDFYFVPGRLTKEKRVDLIIKAFKSMPDKRLVISGDGPERKKLETLVKGCKNIELLGMVPSEKLIDLYARCTAVIYMPMDEPFGLVPIEAMASGKPCIAAAEGGCKETVLHKKTGFLIKPTKSEIVIHVRALTPKVARKMKAACLRKAKEFDIKLFLKTVNRVCTEAMKTQLKRE